jgi:integrase
MEIIIQALQKNRPNIAPSTAKTYYSTLKSIHKYTNDGQELSPKYFTQNQDKILDYLKDIPSSTRKTKLAPLVVICGSNDCVKKYRELMMDDIKEYTEQIHLNQKSQKQKENWISQAEVKELFTQYEKSVSPIWTKVRKNIELTKAEFNRLSEFITLALFVLQAPRRILDYTEFKIRNINKKEDNYLKGNKMVFNRYKTAKSHGQQEVDVNPLLLKYLRLWTKANPTEYLLVDSKQTKLSQPQLTLRLNNIFGKNVSVNMLRHIFITDELGEDIERLEKKAEAMGHTVDTQRTYVKKE